MHLFRKSSSASDNFLRTCLNFRRDYEIISLTCCRGIQELAPKEDRQVVEFCLTKLFELHEMNISGLWTVLLILQNLESVEWDQRNKIERDLPC